MPEIINLVGQKFGLLTVLKFEEIINHRTRWLCQCKCGKQPVVRSSNLRGEKTRSCGCLKGEGNKLRPYEALYNYFLYSAKTRSITCTMSYEEFLRFTKQIHCHYCDSKISWSSFAISKNGAKHNLDRKNNNLGYNKSNCVVCCWRCNRGKSSMFTYIEWRSMTDCLRNGWRIK
jgi:hypothetical protein